MLLICRQRGTKENGSRGENESQSEILGKNSNELMVISSNVNGLNNMQKCKSVMVNLDKKKADLYLLKQTQVRQVTTKGIDN